MTKRFQADASIRHTGPLWVATVDTPQGQIQTSAESPTTAFARLQTATERKLGGEVELTPDWGLPKELARDYANFKKRLAVYKELVPWIAEQRVHLANQMRHYDMSKELIAKLVGLSPQRLGRLLEAAARGDSVTTQRGRRSVLFDEDE